MVACFGVSGFIRVGRSVKGRLEGPFSMFNRLPFSVGAMNIKTLPLLFGAAALLAGTSTAVIAQELQRGASVLDRPRPELDPLGIRQGGFDLPEDRAWHHLRRQRLRLRYRRGRRLPVQVLPSVAVQSVSTVTSCASAPAPTSAAMPTTPARITSTISSPAAGASTSRASRPCRWTLRTASCMTTAATRHSRCGGRAGRVHPKRGGAGIHPAVQPFPDQLQPRSRERGL